MALDDRIDVSILLLSIITMIKNSNKKDEKVVEKNRPNCALK